MLSHLNTNKMKTTLHNGTTRDRVKTFVFAKRNREKTSQRIETKRNDTKRKPTKNVVQIRKVFSGYYWIHISPIDTRTCSRMLVCTLYSLLLLLFNLVRLMAFYRMMLHEFVYSVFGQHTHGSLLFLFSFSFMLFSLHLRYCSFAFELVQFFLLVFSCSNVPVCVYVFCFKIFRLDLVEDDCSFHRRVVW